MSAPRHALESFVALQVCSFLDPRSLCSAEAAGLDRSTATACWTALLSALEEQLAGKVLRKPESKSTLPADPREALWELQLWLRNLARFPKPWTICMRKISDLDIDMHPRPTCPGCAIASGDHHDGMLDYVGSTEGPPKLAQVPVSVGGVRGKPMFVEILLTAATLSKVCDEACMLGVELFGHNKGHRQGTYFCPICGKVFVRFPGEDDGLVAQAMPALKEVFTEDDFQGVQAFVLVDASGCISFGRRRSLGHSIEWSGEIGSDCQPPQTAEYCASLTFQVDKLEAPAQITITRAGDLPPEQQKGSLKEFDSVWGVHEWPCASSTLSRSAWCSM